MNCLRAFGKKQVGIFVRLYFGALRLVPEPRV